MKLRIQPPFQIVARHLPDGAELGLPGSPTGLPKRAFDTGCICLSTKRPGKSERAARRRSDPAHLTAPYDSFPATANNSGSRWCLSLSPTAPGWHRWSFPACDPGHKNSNGVLSPRLLDIRNQPQGTTQFSERCVRRSHRPKRFSPIDPGLFQSPFCSGNALCPCARVLC